MYISKQFSFLGAGADAYCGTKMADVLYIYTSYEDIVWHLNSISALFVWGNKELKKQSAQTHDLKEQARRPYFNYQVSGWRAQI